MQYSVLPAYILSSHIHDKYDKLTKAFRGSCVLSTPLFLFSSGQWVVISCSVILAFMTFY